MSELKNYTRYARQIPLIGTTGQNILSKSKVLVVGIGGLGCPLSLYLSQAGIGHLTLIDDDAIDESNLHRQILFPEEKVGSYKTQIAKEELNKRNSKTNIKIYSGKLNEHNAVNLIKEHDVIVDCADNYNISYLLNSVSRELKLPLISANILVDEASLVTLNYNNGPCLECIFPEKPPLSLITNCSNSGILGVDVGIVGLLQTREVINVLLGRPKLHKKIMNINLDTFSVKIRAIKKKVTCSSEQCGEKILDSSKEMNICFDKFLDKLKKKPDIQLIDVRSHEEHNKKNFGGINIPLKDLPEKASLLNNKKPIIIYCSSGKRSQEASTFLAQKGFDQIFNLENGIDS